MPGPTTHDCTRSVVPAAAVVHDHLGVARPDRVGRTPGVAHHPGAAVIAAPVDSTPAPG